MSVLDDLIKIKGSAQEDDLLKLLDEIPVYEKLSVNEGFRDLTRSEIARSKCPLLAAFADGRLYETVLADLAANVYLQIEGDIPAVLRAAAEKTLRQQKQIGILQQSIVHVEYHDLMEYDHEKMEGSLAAVFTNKCQNGTTAVLIVRDAAGYKMYHGSYAPKESGSVANGIRTPLAIHGKNGAFTMNSYSVLGNNGYRFGTYVDEGASYDVMIGPDGMLYLLKGSTWVRYGISAEERNFLNMSKKDPWEFARTVTSIIESAVHGS